MDKTRQATIAVLTALGIGAVGYSAGYYTIKDPDAKEFSTVTEKDVEVKDAVVSGMLLEKIAESEAVGVIACRKGVVDNLPPDTVYCSDGLRAGFVLPPDAASVIVEDKEARVFVEAGKAYIEAAK